MTELVIVSMIILLLLYMINSNSLYMKLHQTRLDVILQSYQKLPSINTVRTIVVVETSDAHDKLLELCIKSIFNQKYRINNLYIITKDNDNIPEYIKKTCIVVESYNDVRLLEPEETTNVVRLNNIKILDNEEFIRLCRFR